MLCVKNEQKMIGNSLLKYLLISFPRSNDRNGLKKSGVGSILQIINLPNGIFINKIPT